MKLLTITLNTSMDIAYQLDQFNLNKTNRVRSMNKSAGGKGLNVTRVAQTLGISPLATGLIGGPTGEFIVQDLNKDEIKHQFFDTGVDSRRCIAILSGQQQTEILEAGEEIAQNVNDEFIAHVERLIEDCDLVSISGSAPPGIDIAMYGNLIELSKKYKKRVLLDVNGEILNEILKNDNVSAPFLIKPNSEELEQIISKHGSQSFESINKQLNASIFKDIPCVLLSLGADGAIYKYENVLYKVDIPHIEPVNAVGSGDSAIAGFSYGLLNENDVHYAIKCAMAAGMANAIEYKTGFIQKKNFDNFLSKINISKLEEL